MKNFLGALFLVLTVGCAIAPPESQIAQPQGEITLVPYTDESYGFKTLLPEGWQIRGSGVVWRKSSLTDITHVAQQSAPTSAQALLTTLLPRLQVSQPPASVGTHQGETLKWTLYQVNIKMMAAEMTVDLALAEVEGKSYFVYLQTLPQEHDALYQSIFLPTLDTFSPLEVAEEDVPYKVEQVTFKNGDVTLAGALTLPPIGGRNPAVVLVTGSGRQDRDNAMGGIPIKPFKLIAEALTREGIAVLRYDDRGVGGSTGDFAKATLTDFASDAEAAVSYLLARPEINKDQIGLLGHSEGGLVAAMLGARNQDIDFYILMAGPGVNGREVLTMQTRRRMQVDGATQEAIDAEVAFVQALAATVDDPVAMETLVYQRTLEQVRALPEMQRAALGDIEQYARHVAKQTAQEYSAGWFKSFLNYDPAPDWARTLVPVLAFFGGKDIQADAAQNAPALEAALKKAGNPDSKVVVLPGANHVFQAAETGSFSEYASLPPKFTPEFLTTILDWLRMNAHISQ
jgi:uncharacterized protein